jgi:hypothetical protein
MEALNNISLYNNMLNYAKSVVYKNKSNISHIDLVHDLILEKEITDLNYIQEIKSKFFIEVRCKDKIQSSQSLEFNNFNGKQKLNVETHCCKKCQESYPSDYFRNRLLKNGFIQIYYICKKCESQDSMIRQRKKDPITGLTSYMRNHRKKKETDPNYLKRKVKEMQEYRKRKALEKQLS